MRRIMRGKVMKRKAVKRKIIKGDSKRTAVLFLIICLLLSGCGADDGSGTGDSIENNRSSDTESNGSSGAESGQPPMNSANKLYLQDRKSLPYAEPENGYRSAGCFYDTMDGRFYLFRAEEPVEEADGPRVQRICMQVYDSKSQTLEQRILTPEISDHEEFMIHSVGLTSEGELSLKLSCIRGEDNIFFLVKTDLDGNVLETVDPFPDEAQYPWNKSPFWGTSVFHLPDGRTVLCGDIGEDLEVDLLWFDGKAAQKFDRLDCGAPSALTCDENGLLYYVAGGILWRRDLEKNTLDELFRLSENGITNFNNMGLLFNEEGDLLLCCSEQEELFIYVLSNQRVASDVEILMACPDGTSGMEYIQRKASTFSYDTGGALIHIEDETGEDYRNRIVAELTAGAGPDMLMIMEDDLRLLTEKGYLSDLSDMIPADVKAEMIPSVLEMGTVDGKLTGITPQVEFSTLVTGNQTWEKDRWNIFEFLELAQSKEDWEILASHMNTNMGCYMLFYTMFGDGMVGSSLLDLEQGVCRFDSQEFIDILEICKKYSEKSVKLDAAEVNALLKEGKIAAKYSVIYNIVDFSELMGQYSKDCRLVGFPVQEGSGNYVTPYSFRYLAVNANSTHKEEIAEFIAYLLDYENQFSVNGCSVRLDVIRDGVTPDEYFGYVLDDHTYGVQRLTLKPNGDPWLEEFIDFVKNTQPEPFLPDEITNIIGSELSAYFEEGRSAQKTAANIQNRVQLYLDEMK